MFQVSTDSGFVVFLATLATTVGIVLWLVSYFGLANQMDHKYQNLQTIEKIPLCLVPNVALTFAIKIMAGFEGKGNEISTAFLI